MNTTLRNVLAAIAGFVSGSAVNMVIVSTGPLLIAPPAGVDMGDPDALRESMHLLEPIHFAAPFVAHALGTLVGALVGYGLAVARVPVAYTVGALFLAGGVAASFMIPAPAWFVALDLVGAYLPMAMLAMAIGKRFRGEAT